MFKSVTLIVCCVLAAGGFGLLRQTESERAHDEWLRQRYFEATSVKEGMTRAELLKLFETDGGLQQTLPARYALRSSRMIKVDVEFEVPDALKGKIIPEGGAETPAAAPGGEPSPREGYKVVPNGQLRIKSISRPYLEQFNYD